MLPQAGVLMAESGLGGLFMLSFAHDFPFPDHSFSEPRQIRLKKA